jgi:protein TonB
VSEIPTQEPVALAAPVAESAPEPESSASSSATSTSAASEPSEGGGAPLVSVDVNAAYLRNPKPPYPQMSRRLREEGTVRLRVFVLADGSAAKVELRDSSGSPRLDESARTAVNRWRFNPARQGNKTIDSWVIVPISFNLKEYGS